MFRLLIVSLLSLAAAFASSYQVQLGSFNSYETLVASISKIQDKNYKDKLSIEQEDETTYTVYSKTYGTLSQAETALAVYSQVFSDACIKKDGVVMGGKEKRAQASHESSVASESSLWDSVHTSSPSTHKFDNDNEKPKQQKAISFSKELKRKVFYLCYEGEAKGREKPVIRAVFNQNFITYSSETIEIPPIPTPYRLIHNDLHITVGMFSVGSTKSRLDRVTDKYLRTINWVDGKRVQSVRFYYNKRDALAFARRK